MSEIQSNLVPGSIWEREVKSTTKVSVVLFVTNQNLSADVQDKNPPQVVFMTENQKVLSLPIDSFTARRTYTGLNSEVSDLLGAVLVNAIFGDDEDEDDESAAVDVGSIAIDESQFAAVGALDAAAEGEGDYEEPGELFLNVGPHPSKDVLEGNFIGYRESPFHTGDTLHTLSFMLDDDCSLATIHQAFSPSDPNSVQKFEVTVPQVGTFQVDYEGLVGVFVEANGSFAVANLNITSKGDFRGDINSPTVEVVEEVAVVEAPATSPAPQAAPAAPQAAVIVS